MFSSGIQVGLNLDIICFLFSVKRYTGKYVRSYFYGATMNCNTSELCDVYADLVDVIDPIFCNYGGKSSFGGQVVTIKCFEYLGVINQLTNMDGAGKVLVIDGGGSTRRALIDVNIAQCAAHNNWVGIICYGSVRDVDSLEAIDIGIEALENARFMLVLIEHIV